MAFDPIANGATLVNATTPVKKAGFDPIAEGATPTNTQKITDTIIKSQPKHSYTPPNPLNLPSSSISSPGYKPTPSITGQEITAEPKGYNAGNYESRFTAPVETLPWYMQPGRVAHDTIKGALDDFANKATDLSYSLMGLSGKKNDDGTMQKDTIPADHEAVVRASKMFTLGLSSLNVAFSPISAIMQSAEKIPGVGLAAKLVNTAFSKAGEIGQVASDGIVNNLPISDDVKEAIRPSIDGMFSLLGQIALGKVAFDVAMPELDKYHTEISDKIRQEQLNSPDLQRKIPVESQGTENPVKVNIPEKTKVPVSSKTPNETSININKAYTPDNELPVIDFGKPVKKSESDVVPLPNSEQSTKTYQELIDEINKKQPVVAVSKQPVLETNKSAETSSTVPPVKTATEAEPGMVNVRTAKSASDISQKLVENGFKDLPESEKAKYSPTTKAEQIQKVSDLISNNIEDAKAMIRGEKPIPNDIKGQVLFNAMEKFATENKDGVLMADLARSKLASELSEAAQTLGSHGFNDNPHSPIEAIRNITKVREAEYMKRTGQSAEKAKKSIIKSEESNLKTELKSSASKKPTWEKFIQDLSCAV